MIKLEFYDGTKIYSSPVGTLMTPELMYATYPAIRSFSYVIQTDEDGEICYGVLLFSALKNQNGINSSLTDLEAIIALEECLNTPPVVVENTEPTAEERIAAAMEYQNLLSM